MALDLHSTAIDIVAARPTIAVFGIGAIEQHGRHLPIGTDWIAVCEVARLAAIELNALLIPSIPFSMSECHGLMPGTIWLKPATLAAVLRDVVRSLREQEIHKVLVINGHGGNFILVPAIQALNHEFADMRIVMPPEVWTFPDESTPIFKTSASEVHAGEAETSILLHIIPEDVKPERKDFDPSVGREFLDYAFIHQINPEGVWGHPSYGEAAKGERAIAARVRIVVDYARLAFGDL
jgi:creatinine amidohydrolase